MSFLSAHSSPAGTSLCLLLLFLLVGVLPSSPAASAASVHSSSHFLGFLNQAYQPYPSSSSYNLLTHPHLLVNALFTFLSHGSCPRWTLDTPSAVLGQHCWTHPGSYVQAVALRVRVDSHQVQDIKLVSGGRRSGFDGLWVNGATVRRGGHYSAGELLVMYNDSHTVTVNAPLFRFVFLNSDHFMNVEVEPKVDVDAATLGGLLGSSAGGPYERSQLTDIEGTTEDYRLLRGDLFGSDFVYNLWHD